MPTDPKLPLGHLFDEGPDGHIGNYCWAHVGNGDCGRPRADHEPAPEPDEADRIAAWAEPHVTPEALARAIREYGERQIEALSKQVVLDREARDAALKRVEEAEAGLARLRSVWPHIEVPDGPQRFLHGKRPVKDPGPPTCLRCKIEEAIRG